MYWEISIAKFYLVRDIANRDKRANVSIRFHPSKDFDLYLIRASERERERETIRRTMRRLDRFWTNRERRLRYLHQKINFYYNHGYNYKYLDKYSSQFIIIRYNYRIGRKIVEKFLMRWEKEWKSISLCVRNFRSSNSTRRFSMLEESTPPRHSNYRFNYILHVWTAAVPLEDTR